MFLLFTQSPEKTEQAIEISDKFHRRKKHVMSRDVHFSPRLCQFPAVAFDGKAARYLLICKRDISMCSDVFPLPPVLEYIS